MSEKNIDEDLTGCACPNANCPGILGKDGQSWRCNKCPTVIKDSTDLWQRMDDFQKEACIRAIIRYASKEVNDE